MIQRKIAFYSFIGLLITCVFFKKLLPLFVIVLTLIWISERDFKKKWKHLLKRPIFLLFPFYFLLLALGFINTENVSYGLQKMETRLSLFILPIILPTLNSLNFTYHRRTFTKVFVLTIFAAAIVCLTYGFYHYFEELAAIKRGVHFDYVYGSRFFFGTVLSDFLMHPGYLAMLANVALIILLFDFKKFESTRLRTLRLIAVVCLSIFVLLLYSKVGIFLMMLIILSFGVRYAWLEKKVSQILVSVGAVGLLGVLVYQFVPHTKTRIDRIYQVIFDKEHDPNSFESTQLRIHAWKASREAINESPIFGYGTGDVWDALEAKYLENGYTAAHKLEVNSHNEYYQTGLAMGYVGISFLVFCF
jgi:O-antigen ligase